MHSLQRRWSNRSGDRGEPKRYVRRSRVSLTGQSIMPCHRCWGTDKEQKPCPVSSSFCDSMSTRMLHRQSRTAPLSDASSSEKMEG